MEDVSVYQLEPTELLSNGTTELSECAKQQYNYY